MLSSLLEIFGSLSKITDLINCELRVTIVKPCVADPSKEDFIFNINRVVKQPELNEGFFKTWIGAIDALLESGVITQDEIEIRNYRLKATRSNGIELAYYYSPEPELP